MAAMPMATPNAARTACRSDRGANHPCLCALSRSQVRPPCESTGGLLRCQAVLNIRQHRDINSIGRQDERFANQLRLTECAFGCRVLCDQTIFFSI